MDIQQAREFSRYRLFRPLTFESPHYHRYRTDNDMATAISKWAANILLGGNTYDLNVKPESVFQIPSWPVNRQVYFVPIWNPELISKIVFATEKKTGRLKKGCGLGPLKKLEFAVGILVLKRVVFRGTKLFQQGHRSESKWYTQDRYHLDVFVYDEGNAEKEESVKHKPYEPEYKPLIRVFHDSAGCVVTPRWAPGPDLSTYNGSIRDGLDEHFPKADEIIMSWHELSEYLGVQKSGIYALSTFVAKAAAQGVHYLAVGSSFFWGETRDGDTIHETDLSIADDTLWTDPDQPLSQDLVRSYDRFTARSYIDPYYGPKQEFPVDTYSNTNFFNSNLSAALVQFLLAQAAGGATYIGHGYFRLRSENFLPLAAGTGNWGSSEYADISISRTPDDDDTTGGGGGGNGVTPGGLTSLIVDGLRYLQQEEIEAELENCRNNSSAECQECVDDSLADTYHDLGVAADVIDAIAGIAACVLVAIFAAPAAPFVCGVTLPAAGAAIKDLWDEMTGDYNLADDYCSGLPDQSPTYTSSGDGGNGGSDDEREEAEEEMEKFMQMCRDEGGFPSVERIIRRDACMADPKRFCELYSTINDATKRLKGAVCIEGKGDTNDEVICVWCTSGVG